MHFYCAYTWFPKTRPEEVWERVIHQHERSSNAPELIRGWYDFAGGGAGFLIVETDDVRELTAMLRPYIDLMAWDIRALSENRVRRDGPANPGRPGPDGPPGGLRHHHAGGGRVLNEAPPGLRVMLQIRGRSLAASSNSASARRLTTRFLVPRNDTTL